MSADYVLKDSGEREEFETGARRDTRNKKGRYDLITPEFERRLARVMELGAEKYGDHNWEKGIPYSRCLDSAKRHLAQWAAGLTDEDHLAHAAANIMFIITFDEREMGMDDRHIW